jgi:molybdate transport system substrate-binding protein
MKGLQIAAALAMLCIPGAAKAQQTVLLHAAGSLRGALTEVSKAFEAASGVKVDGKYGPSGLLRNEIAGDAKSEVFASANMNHPLSLEKDGKSGVVKRFTRNSLCALAKPGLEVNGANLLDRMLEANVKLGTSTPKADPSGDYAWEVFKKAEALKPGSFAVLEKKALQLTGGPNSPPPPKDRNVYGAVVADGQADIFLTYCTNAVVAKRENPSQQILQLPANLLVGADYGLTVVKGATANADKLAAFILSSEGQAILAKHGFASPN